MKKLINLSTYEYDMDRFNRDKEKLNEFLSKHKLDGVELLNPLEHNESIILSDKVIGVHLKFYPVWLDFYRGNKKELLEDFKSMDQVIKAFGSDNPSILAKNYRKEIKIAQKLNADYVVFHVSHTKFKHCYDYKFTYTDKEVLDATAKLVNEIFEDLDTDVTILFENLWYPGLTMLNLDLAKEFIESIKYENKGFMLDTGHLLNTNLNINTEEEGINYLIDTVNNLGDLKSYIKGIHLTKSMSQEYVKSQLKKYKNIEKVVNPDSHEIFYHIFKVDEHKPFTNIKIRELIDIIEPKYVVYEFITESLEQLEEFINVQDNTIEYRLNS